MSNSMPQGAEDGVVDVIIVVDVVLVVLVVEVVMVVVVVIATVVVEVVIVAGRFQDLSNSMFVNQWEGIRVEAGVVNSLTVQPASLLLFQRGRHLQQGTH